MTVYLNILDNSSNFSSGNYLKESFLFDGYYYGSNTPNIKKDWTTLLSSYSSTLRYDYSNINNDRFVTFKFTKNLASKELIINFIENSDDDKELYTSCYSNAAMCHIKTSNWTEAVKSASVVLGVEGYENNVKALYRRGISKMNTGNLKDAKVDLMAAYKADPKNKDVRQGIAKLKDEIAAAKKKEKSTARKRATDPKSGVVLFLYFFF